ncbi:MAG: DMT family transporter [Acidimicrobiales bacterium]
MLVIVASLCAAFLLGLGFVIQQHAAARAPAEERLSLRLLVDLAQRPVWLAGIGVMVVGQVFGAYALGNGRLTVVEPLLAASLLFALPMAAVWSRQRLGRREWAGAVTLMGGLAMFMVAAGPQQVNRTTAVSHESWLVAGLTIVAVVMVVVWFAKRTDVAEEATLLALGAGTLYGLQDALTQRSIALFPRGIEVVVSSWQPWALLAVAVVGLLLAQSAFEAAPLAASLPAITIAEPLTGIGLGAGLFSQEVRLSGISLGFELAGVVLMVVGVLAVARSPVVTGPRMVRQEDPSRAA